MHELGLLFYHFLIRKAGYRTYYLGQNVPHEDLVSVYKVHQPEYILTTITSRTAVPIEKYLKQLEIDFGAAKILASGYQVQKFSGSKLGNVQTFSTALELLRFI
jgi:methanogenic corrinoid protein MtbC1